MTLPIGYPDFQRVVDWDGPVLWSKNTGSTNLPVQSGLLEVSKYAAIGGRLQCTVGPIAVQMQYKADKAGLIGAGNRNFQLSELVGDSAVPTMRNLGPYVNVVCSSPAGADYQLVADLFATNRLQPIEFTPAFGVLIDEQVFSIVAGDNPFYPAGYFAGPIAIALFNAGASQTVYLQALNAAGFWDYIAGEVVTGPTFGFQAVAPPGAWRIDIASTGAVGGLRLAVVPSMTGST